MKETTFLAWPDTHLPYEDKQAVDVALQILAWYKPHTVVILGDLMDFSSVSHWLRDKRRSSEGLRLTDDYKAGNALLDKITKHCKRLVYINGNHERFLYDAIERNPEFDGLINLEIGLKFEERRKAGLDLIHRDQHGKCWNLGNLWFTHGTYVGKHHAQTHVDAYGRSIVYGHTHTIQSHVRISPIDVEDKHIGLSLGCLAGKNPNYMQHRPNAWVHAVGVGVVRQDGNFNIDPIIICDGTTSYAGRTFNSRKVS